MTWFTGRTTISPSAKKLTRPIGTVPSSRRHSWYGRISSPAWSAGYRDISRSARLRAIGAASDPGLGGGHWLRAEVPGDRVFRLDSAWLPPQAVVGSEAGGTALGGPAPARPGPGATAPRSGLSPGAAVVPRPRLGPRGRLPAVPGRQEPGARRPRRRSAGTGWPRLACGRARRLSRVPRCQTAFFHARVPAHPRVGPNVTARRALVLGADLR